MDEMEAWGDLVDQSLRKVLTKKDEHDKWNVSDMENHFGRPLIGKILVLSRNSAEQFSYWRPWACISICDSDDVAAELKSSNLVDVLRLSFDDITRITPNHIRMTIEHGQQVHAFVDRVWDKIDLLMIHCNAGVSRSPACGLVISERRQPSFVHFFEDLFTPNTFVTKILRNS